MSEVHVMDHPLIQHKISYIRREDVGTKEFREVISDSGRKSRSHRSVP